MPFKPGEGRAPKLTPAVHELFVGTVRRSGRLSLAAKACAVHVATVYNWLQKGRTQRPGQLYRDFLEAVSRAQVDFLALAAGRHHQLAIGGVIQLPAYDKDFNPIRAHKPDCKTPDRCKCDLIFTEKVVMPDVRALEWELDRLDPQGPIEEQPMEAGRSQAEITAEGARRLDLFYNSVKILVDLGVPLPQIAPPAIETTAKKVKPEPISPADGEVTLPAGSDKRG